MKFMATSDFRNTEKFKVEGKKPGDLHIAKGDTFEADMDDKRINDVIGILGHCGRVIDVEAQPAAAEKILAEVAAEKKKAAEIAKTAEAPKK